MHPWYPRGINASYTTPWSTIEYFEPWVASIQTKTQFWDHVHAQLETLLVVDGEGQWVGCANFLLADDKFT